MSVKKEVFGIHPSGKEVYKFEITNKQGMKAVITNFGAILISLFVKDKKGNFQDVVLGYDSLEEYLDNHPMFGATVGRNVNRISNAKFELDERPIEEGCQCPACRRYSRAYIRHLLKAKEMLGMRLCVLHNLYYYNHLMEDIREAIEEGRYARFKKETLAKMEEKED